MSTTEIITVTVKHGTDNLARAGSGARACKASSTNSSEIAARAAAAKYFRVRDGEIALFHSQHGACGYNPTPDIYFAAIGRRGIRQVLEAYNPATSKQVKFKTVAGVEAVFNSRRAKR